MDAQVVSLKGPKLKLDGGPWVKANTFCIVLNDAERC